MHSIAQAFKTFYGFLSQTMGFWSNYKRRRHEDAVEAGVLAIRHHIERFPEDGAVGRKVLKKSQWVALIPSLPNQRVADDVLERLNARQVGTTAQPEVYLLIDLNPPRPHCGR